MKLYREVKASERLPEEDGIYNTDIGVLIYTSYGSWSHEYKQPKWWLEQLPEQKVGEDIVNVFLRLSSSTDLLGHSVLQFDEFKRALQFHHPQPIIEERIEEIVEWMNVARCPACDGGGTIRGGDQCQWCNEKEGFKTTLKELNL